MNKVGIIGAGVMGSSIAYIFSYYNFDVTVVDINQETLDKSKKMIAENQLLHRFSKQHDGRKNNLEQICFTTDLENLKEADIIIESISEDFEKKKMVYLKMKDIVKESCIIISNTSCIPITKLSSFCKDASKVIGVHFMNPVSLIHSVEVIKSKYTSEETIQLTQDLMKRIDKKVYLVNDSPGFVSNRVSHLIMNEAAFLVQEKVAPVETIDNIFKHCYGHKMGPLETADLIGIDTVVMSLNILYEEFRDEKFRCCPLLKQMVEAGEFGKKSGKGFYSY